MGTRKDKDDFDRDAIWKLIEFQGFSINKAAKTLGISWRRVKRLFDQCVPYGD